jgi:hypothetical protein
MKKKQKKFTTGIGNEGGVVMDVKDHPARAMPATSSAFGQEPTMGMDHLGGNVPDNAWQYSPDLHPYIGGS